MKRSLVLLLFAIASSATAAPAITFESHAVIATGVTPGGTTAWFAVSHEASRYPARISRNASVLADEGDGMVRLDLPHEIPVSSVWIVADVETGETTVAAPAGFKVKSSTLPAAALRHRASGIAPHVQLDVDEVEVLYVRPRIGAWSTRSGRALALHSMEPLGDSPAPPDDFAANDMIVVVDPFAMTVRTLRVR